MSPELSIVITSYRNPALLDLCLRSLSESIQGIKYEVIVADCATDEDTIEMMGEKYPEVTFFPNECNTGFGFLVNQGTEAAKGEYLFIINADIIIKDKNAVTELLLFLKQNPGVGMVGPQLINFDNSVQPSCFRFYTPLTVLYRRTFLKRFSFAKKHLERFLMEDCGKDDHPVEADWIMGSAMMITKKALQKVGGMDTGRYWMYFDDVDWCWRFWEAGFKVMYFPKVRVFHYHGKQSGSRNALKSLLVNKYTRTHIKSAINFFIKYWGKPNPHNSYGIRGQSK